MNKVEPNHQAGYEALVGLTPVEIKRRIAISAYTDADFVASEVLATLIRRGFGGEQGILDAAIAELYRRLTILVAAYFNKNSQLAGVLQKNSIEDVVQFAWMALLADAHDLSFAKKRFLVWIERRATDFVRLHIARTRGEASWDIDLPDQDDDDAGVIDGKLVVIVARFRLGRSAPFLHEQVYEAMEHRRSSTPIRAASSPARRSPASSSGTASRSAWTAKAAGATTCSSNGSGNRSSTRRCIYTPTIPSRRLRRHLPCTSRSTTPDDLTRVLIASPDQVYLNRALPIPRAA